METTSQKIQNHIKECSDIKNDIIDLIINVTDSDNKKLRNSAANVTRCLKKILDITGNETSPEMEEEDSKYLIGLGREVESFFGEKEKAFLDILIKMFNTYSMTDTTKEEKILSIELFERFKTFCEHSQIKRVKFELL